MNEGTSRSIYLRDSNWKIVDEIVEHSRGSYRSRSHVVEHLLVTDITLEELRKEVMQIGED